MSDHLFQAGELLFSVLPAVVGVAGMCVVSGRNRESLTDGGNADGGSREQRAWLGSPVCRRR
jgi:hypothetical protein